MFSCLPSVLLFLLSVLVYLQNLFNPFLADLFTALILYSFFSVYFSGLNVLSRFNLCCLISVIASHVALLIYSSFLILIKNNLSCTSIKFINGFPFCLYNVKYSCCHIWKLIWMLQQKTIPYLFILHFRAINLSSNIFLILLSFSWQSLDFHGCYV